MECGWWGGRREGCGSHGAPLPGRTAALGLVDRMDYEGMRKGGDLGGSAAGPRDALVVGVVGERERVTPEAVALLFFLLLPALWKLVLVAHERPATRGFFLRRRRPSQACFIMRAQSVLCVVGRSGAYLLVSLLVGQALRMCAAVLGVFVDLMKKVRPLPERGSSLPSQLTPWFSRELNIQRPHVAHVCTTVKRLCVLGGGVGDLSILVLAFPAPPCRQAKGCFVKGCFVYFLGWPLCTVATPPGEILSLFFFFSRGVSHGLFGVRQT